MRNSKAEMVLPPRIICISFTEETAFGKKILFIGYTKINPFSPYEFMDTLREKIYGQQ
jgi:hypothetical protein